MVGEPERRRDIASHPLEHPWTRRRRGRRRGRARRAGRPPSIRSPGDARSGHAVRPHLVDVIDRSARRLVVHMHAAVSGLRILCRSRNDVHVPSAPRQILGEPSPPHAADRSVRRKMIGNYEQAARGRRHATNVLGGQARAARAGSTVPGRRRGRAVGGDGRAQPERLDAAPGNPTKHSVSNTQGVECEAVVIAKGSMCAERRNHRSPFASNGLGTRNR